MKIIVIDDEVAVKRLFEQRFRKELKSGQIEFKFLLSAQAALDYLDEVNGQNVSLAFSDINMPGINGIELLKTLRNQYPQIQVFMITAYGDDEKRTEAQQYGAAAYFTKPLDFYALKKHISI